MMLIASCTFRCASVMCIGGSEFQPRALILAFTIFRTSVAGSG